MLQYLKNFLSRLKKSRLPKCPDCHGRGYIRYGVGREVECDCKNGKGVA